MMGYVIAGYPTRRNKRQPVVEPKICYGSEQRSLQQAKTSVRQSKKRKVGLKRHLTIQDLPLEIIQKIFVYAGSHNSMPLLNRFFHLCLRPTSFLINSYIWENFLWDLNESLRNETRARVHVLTSDVFDNRLLIDYLNRNHRFLNVVSNIVNTESLPTLLQERQDKFYKDELDSINESHLKVARHEQLGKPINDFPSSFYNHPNIFFHNDISQHPPVYNQFLLKLHAHFSIKEPILLCDRIFNWFFWQSHSYNINHLFHAINLVLHISLLPNSRLDNVDPLNHLLKNLYLEVSPDISNLLLLDGDEDDAQLNERKARIVEKFIRKFYKDSQNCLSQDDLWQILSQTGERALMELVMRHGGRPGFSVVR